MSPVKSDHRPTYNSLEGTTLPVEHWESAAEKSEAFQGVSLCFILGPIQS